MTTLSALARRAMLIAWIAGCAEGAQGPGGSTETTSATGGGGGASAGGGSPGAGGGGSPSSSGSTGSGSSSSAGGASTTSSTSASTGGGAAPPGTIFFSEYVEGAGNDKALEVWNAGSTPIALGGCVIERYQNGATETATPITLTGGSLAAGATHVLCNSGFSQTNRCDQLDANVSHSGDDAVALVCDGATKDVFGRIGEDATWGSGATSSENADLRRQCGVLQGDTNGGDSFDPADEWQGFAADDFGNLGTHCP